MVMQIIKYNLNKLCSIIYIVHVTMFECATIICQLPEKEKLIYWSSYDKLYEKLLNLFCLCKS